MKSGHFKCKRCGRFFNKSDGTKIIHNKGMICSECMHNLSYNTQNNIRINKETKSGKTYGFELECIPKSKNHKAFMLQSQYKLMATKDSSLPSVGVEFKTPTYNSLRGLRKTFETFYKHVNFRNMKCGQHINIGDRVYINRYSMDWLDVYGAYIFDELYNYMYEHKEETVKACGRFFTDYARHTTYYSTHSSWINLSHDNRIEFRLSKFVTPEQYFTLTCMWTEMLDCIINNIIKPFKCYAYNVDIDDNKFKHKCNIVSKRLIKVFNKYTKKVEQ